MITHNLNNITANLFIVFLTFQVDKKGHARFATSLENVNTSRTHSHPYVRGTKAEIYGSHVDGVIIQNLFPHLLVSLRSHCGTYIETIAEIIFFALESWKIPTS